MKKLKMRKLQEKGWITGDAKDLLGLSPQEAAYVEMKVALGQKLKAKRIKKHLTQQQLAKMVHSSQSRIAKMEKNDPTVSIDLLVKSLLLLGSSRTELARAIS